MDQVEAPAATAIDGRIAIDLLVLAGFCAFLFFFGLGAFGLIGADEPRYAQIAREMLARHDWVTPVLYGKPWLEKPVLYYWEAMLSFRLFGVSDWAARLPSAFDATALIFVLYAFARRFLRGVQLDAALIAASFAGIIGFARAASTDLPLTATFGIAMLAWAAWHLEPFVAPASSPAGPADSTKAPAGSPAHSTDSHPEKNCHPERSEGSAFVAPASSPAGRADRTKAPAGSPTDCHPERSEGSAFVSEGHGFSRADTTTRGTAALAAEGQFSKLYLAAFYLFLALATLAKGPVAPFLAVLIILLMAVIRRNGRILTRTLWIPGILLYLVVALPWYILVQVRTGNFFRVFILQHNLERFGTPVFHHTQPFWYYALVLPLALTPWVVFAITGLISAIRKSSVSSVFAVVNSRDADLNLFLSVWALISPVFFSFSGSKLPGYILPSIPPFALLLAAYLRRKLSSGERAPIILNILHSLVAAATLSVALLSYHIVLRMHPTRQPITIAVVIGAIVFAGFALTLRLQGLKALRFVTLIPVIVGLAFVVRFAAPELDNAQSARPVERELAELQIGSKPVAGFNIPRELEYGLAFYRNQPVAMYNRAEIPSQEHLLITHDVPESSIQALVPNRRLLHVGAFPRQGLEFYWVSLTPPPSAMPGMDMHGEHPHSHQMK